jgi:hypothetical protein
MACSVAVLDFLIVTLERESVLSQQETASLCEGSRDTNIC